MRFRVVALRAILHTPHPVPLATLTSATCFTERQRAGLLPILRDWKIKSQVHVVLRA